jgi:hypothetical protein
MSKGLGELQRWLLAELEARPKEALTTRDLAAQRLAGLNVSAMEANRRWQSTNSAVRRALRGLVKASRIAQVRRGGGGGSDRDASYTANLSKVDHQRRERTDADAAAAQLAMMNQPKEQIVSASEFELRAHVEQYEENRRRADQQANEAKLEGMRARVRHRGAKVRAKPGEAAAGLGDLPQALLAELEARPEEALTLAELAGVGPSAKESSQKAIKNALGALARAGFVAEVRPADGGRARYGYIARPRQE